MCRKFFQCSWFANDQTIENVCTLLILQNGRIIDRKQMLPVISGWMFATCGLENWQTNHNRILKFVGWLGKTVYRFGECISVGCIRVDDHLYLLCVAMLVRSWKVYDMESVSSLVTEDLETLLLWFTQKEMVSMQYRMLIVHVLPNRIITDPPRMLLANWYREVSRSWNQIGWRSLPDIIPAISHRYCRSSWFE